MKIRLTLICLFISCALVTQAQKFEVETIFLNGEKDKHINFVFLGDGYQEHEFTKYLEDVRKTVDGIFLKSPFKEYKNYFNVFAVLVPSKESGATHPNTAKDENPYSDQPYAKVDNYFGSTFDYNGIHRLLVPVNKFAITTVLANNFPEYDQVFILVNSPYYGGSGGPYSISSTHDEAIEIAVHEIGHSLAKLADEYWAGDNYAGERPNMTQNASRATIKWRNWLFDQGVGIYPFEASPTWYRPHQRCSMAYLSTANFEVNFCPVCSETIVERIHDLVSPLRGWLPHDAFTSKQNEPLSFALDLLKPEPNTLRAQWTLNGLIVGSDSDVLSLAPEQLKPGANMLTVTLFDTTALSRANYHSTLHFYTVSWEIQQSSERISSVNKAGMTVGRKNPVTENTASEGIAQKVAIRFIPNPTTDLLRMSYTLEHAADVQVQLLSLDGKILSTTNSSRKDTGTHQEEISMVNLSAGAYLVRFYINGSAVSGKVVKAE